MSSTTDRAVPDAEAPSALRRPSGGDLCTPEARADALLRAVLGPDRYEQFRSEGRLCLPSRLVPGRYYLLDTNGQLAYRDPGERHFRTTLCIQPREAIPLDDQVAMRYLLVTADEERLLAVANPITFGFLALTRVLYRDCRSEAPPWIAVPLTLLILGFFLGSFAIELWLASNLLARQPFLALAAMSLLAVPGFVGLLLVLAALNELARAVARFLGAWSFRRESRQSERSDFWHTSCH